MKTKVIITVFLIFITLHKPVFVFAQLFYNNGAPVSITNGGLVYVNGSVVNAASGTLENNGNATITGDFTNHNTAGGNGTYYIGGNWINNAVFNAGNGKVELNGFSQNLSGSASTHFNDLVLSGTGIKTQTIDQYVDGVLSLNDRELATGSFSMIISNNLPSAITRTTGFVSSTLGGSLVRNTNSNSMYLFPVGSSSGPIRYRPVEINPTLSIVSGFSVRMANLDATTEGYDRSLIDSSICEVNPLFFHYIKNVGQVVNYDLKIYFDSIADGNWEKIANWNNGTSIWNHAGVSGFVSGTPLSAISLSNWNESGNFPHILSRKKADATIFPIDTICLKDTVILLTAAEPGGTWSGTGISDPDNGIFLPALTGTGEFIITYSIPGVCGDVKSRQIIVEDCSEDVIYVPNIFSPNGDGQNDFLFVRGTFKSLHFSVYDRWGEIVFETTDANMGWDGKFKGKPMNPGVFAYYAIIERNDGKKIVKSGNVSLVR